LRPLLRVLSDEELKQVEACGGSDRVHRFGDRGAQEGAVR